MTTTRTEIPTVTIECSCKYCRDYAAKKGLALPMRAEVNQKMAATICKTAKGRHNMVKRAWQPTAGDAMQAKFGPWKVEQ